MTARPAIVAVLSLVVALMSPAAALAMPPAESPAHQDPVLKAGGLPTAVFSLQPDHVVVSMCAAHQSTHVVASVTGLRAFSFRLAFDPELLALSDLDAEQAGQQLRLGEAVRSLPHTVLVNHVDATQGVAELSVEILDGAALDGEVTLATIMWLPIQPGDGILEFQDAAVTIDSEEAPMIAARSAAVGVSPTCGEVFGICLLQGRTAHAGVWVVNDRGDEAWTDSLGQFTISGTPVITLSHPAYMTAQVDLRGRLSQIEPVSDPAHVDLGEIRLWAGDLNEDDLVNVFDLTYMANFYQTDAGVADINADGFVDVLDMVLVANNFGIQGPIVVQ